ncbi:4099_t:CDS:2 [Cetraspora pellucida]|uniref:4099_t:CDS:1 n=1 Tax=Cetraspora pellucida TaxID=1433469 RepID=A0A9N8Z7X5_9GLOM|nr:4099_t:CDS:2 [Cetraspora pellucida]
MSELMLTNHMSKTLSSSYINEIRKFKTKKKTSTLDSYILHIWSTEDGSNQRQRTPDELNIINTFLACASSQNLNVQFKNDIDGFGYRMQQKLERRWADWEQPLLFLAIIFHLQYHVQALFDANFFSLEKIIKWIEYYYEINERFENTIEAILAEVETNNANGLALL